MPVKATVYLSPTDWLTVKRDWLPLSEANSSFGIGSYQIRLDSTMKPGRALLVGTGGFMIVPLPDLDLLLQPAAFGAVTRGG